MSFYKHVPSVYCLALAVSATQYCSVCFLFTLLFFLDMRNELKPLQIFMPRRSCFFFSPHAEGNAGLSMCLLFSLFCPDAWDNFPSWLARSSRMAKHSFVFSTWPELSAPADTGSLPGVTFKCWSNKICIYVEQHSCVCSPEPGVMRKH